MCIRDRKTLWYSPEVLLTQADAAEIADGEEITLIHWGNVVCEKVAKDEKTGEVTAISAKLNLAGDVKKTKKKLTWLADTPDLVDVELVDLDFLLTKDKIEEDDDIKAILNPKTKFVDAARGEASLRQLQHGQIIQVERRGYYICDRPYLRPACLLYTSPSPRDATLSRMPSSA